MKYFADLDYNILLNELIYFTKYYGSKVKPQQGLDEIFDVIKKYSIEGSWVDLGGGSNTPFWRMGIKKVNKILSCDINREAFVISEMIINNFRLSPCFEYVRELIGEGWDKNNKIQISYKQIDLLNEVIELDGKYENITQFGLLGLTTEKSDFLSKTREILQFLKKDSVYIGANWIFSSKYQKKTGFSNKFIDEGLINSLNDDKYEVLYCKKHMIYNDPNYTHLILYVIKAVK